MIWWHGKEETAVQQTDTEGGDTEERCEMAAGWGAE